MESDNSAKGDAMSRTPFLTNGVVLMLLMGVKPKETVEVHLEFPVRKVIIE